jgi:uncharacterized protein
MATSVSIGSVAGLWRFPVKSMRGERLAHAELTGRGLVGDRAYALIDADPARSASFGRDVTLARAAPEDFTIDQYHPDVAAADPAGYRDQVVERKLGAAFFAEAGLPSPVPVGAFFDLFPVSVLTTSALERLRRLRPESRFDERRFRMNLIVDADEAGFVENQWIGRALAVGDVARLRVALPDSRCVMTTLAQGELPGDTDVLRALVRRNRVPIGDAGPFPCAGVYAVVEAPGPMRIGDRVALPRAQAAPARIARPAATLPSGCSRW